MSKQNDTLKTDSSKNEDLRLVELAKEGDNDAIKSLIDKHSGICVDTYKKYLNLPNVSGFISDEIVSSKDYIIYNSAKTFDPDMGSKFSTWLANQTRFYCLNCINKYNKLVPIEDESIKLIIESNNKINGSELESKKLELNTEILDLVKETLSSLTNKKIKECISKKYFSGSDRQKSYTDIASEMGVTVQTVINWHKKFIKLVRQKCKNRKIIFDF
jgi:RNA polymerase sigma factor (sigma-70 family)